MRVALLLLPQMLLCAGTDPSLGGKILLEDNFAEQQVDKSWRITKGKWESAGGILRASELQADKHAAVMRRKVAFTNATIELHFRLDAAKQVALSINGAGGHICRAVVRADGISLIRDADKKAGQKAIVLASSKDAVPTDQWHVLYLMVSGEKLRARIGAGAWIEGSHPSLAAPKADVGIPVRGETASFDSIRIYQLP
jgi:hypothetical protein